MASFRAVYPISQLARGSGFHESPGGIETNLELAFLCLYALFRLVGACQGAEYEQGYMVSRSMLSLIKSNDGWAKRLAATSNACVLV